MKQVLKRPCKHCPFRSDLPHGYLSEARVTEIAEGVLRGESFPCHQTTVEAECFDGESELVANADSQQCAGAEIFCAKQGCSSQMARIAERLGMPVAELDMDAPVCGSHAAMLKAHGHEPPAEDEWQACSVVDGERVCNNCGEEQ